MAKRSLILSNDDGRVAFSDINYISVEDSTTGNILGNVSASNIFVSGTYRISSSIFPITYATGTLLSSSNGRTFVTSSLIGTTGLSGCLGWDGSKFVITNIIDPSDYSGIPDGVNVTGDYKDDVRVVNINTVSSGTLSAARGGTGLNGSAYPMSRNLILKGSGSSPTQFSTLSASASGTVIVSYDGKIETMFPSHRPDVRFYDTPGTYTWNRPPGAKFAKICIQGAGGGGAGAGYLSSTQYGGDGGSSGAYIEVTYDVANIPTASITVGIGGNGGTGQPASLPTQNNNLRSGSDGGPSILNIAGTTFTAGGGGGGKSIGGSGTTKTIPTRGIATPSVINGGLAKNGYLGGHTNTNNTANIVPEIAYGMPSGGGSRASSNGGTIIPLVFNRSYGFLETTGKNLSDQSILLASGSSLQAAANPAPAPAPRPGFGAGGGGGAITLVAGTTMGDGSPGGHGYALVISW